MKEDLPRVMIAAAYSGGGKTTITCGILKALCERGMALSAFKCGPDYIDPLFHREMIGAKSSNLDLFFTEEETTKFLFAKQAKDTELSIIEGVMGYYDGLGGTTTTASAYHLSNVLECPTILVVDGKGISLSICAQIRGFCDFRESSNIIGVILNRCSKAMCKLLTPLIEAECQVQVLGCLPYNPEYAMESRHLGLVTAAEVESLHAKLHKLAETVETHVELDRLIQIAQNAKTLEYMSCEVLPVTKKEPIIAVARDKAFCFYYEESLQLLQELGARIAYFSPLANEAILEDASGLYIGGGYPELYLEKLSKNQRTKDSIRKAVEAGMPTIAECGGFMYLTQEIEGQPMVGVLEGVCHNTGKLGRFGYITLTAREENLLCEVGESIPAHEFHYYDCSCNGEAFHAEKPVGNRAWNAGYAMGNVVAGFPHLYLRGNVTFGKQFVEKCEGFRWN